MNAPTLSLVVLDDGFGISRLGPAEPVPAWAWTGDVVCVARTADELSIVCREDAVPAEVRCERGWRCLRAEGPFDFGLTGILASLCSPLAAAGVPIFAFSTFDTDYLLVRAADLPRAVEALSGAGHRISPR